MPPAMDASPAYVLVRESYRAAFKHAVAAGDARPLVLPYSLLGAFVVPTLWLALPHTTRPWLYRTRWLVMLFVAVFNADVVLRTSSTNMACAYAAGLMAAWGIVSNANLLLWKRPQFESARVVRRRKKQQSPSAVALPDNSPDDEHVRAVAGNGAQSEPRLRSNVVESLECRRTDTSSHAPGQADGGYDLVWEPFPVDASFSHRLNWALDLVCCFRGAGWSHTIDSIPHPEIPARITPGMTVNLKDMPIVSRSGYARCLTERDFVRSRVRNALASYLVLDFLAVFMTKDPYFVFGPDYTAPLPHYLEPVPEGLLLAYRQIFVVVAVIAALEGAFGLNDLADFYLMRRLFPRYQELWLYPSTYGSWRQILDRGLSGWWGCWWHQTFRMQFASPSAFLSRKGFITIGSSQAALLSVLIAFVQSGFLHACGSITTIPDTKAWRSPAFFMLQAVGTVLQRQAWVMYKQRSPQPSRFVTRSLNLVFTALWLYLTSGFFVDDLASSGLWLFEPVPISPFRWLGLGHQSDHWWRWDRDFFPTWYSGRSWLDTGIGL